MTRRLWTPDEVRLLQNWYAKTTAEELAVVLERTVSQVYCKAQALGLKKDPEFVKELGRKYSQHPNAVAHRFKPGTIPPNKGKKVRPETYEKMRGTMFKKGSVPPNTQPMGTEQLRADGYIWRKIGHKKWKQVHRILWEENYGPVPAGHIVSFKNKNTRDIRLENLYLISRAEQLKTENSMIARYPEDLRKLIHTKAQIKRKLTYIANENTQKHRDPGSTEPSV